MKESELILARKLEHIRTVIQKLKWQEEEEVPSEYDFDTFCCDFDTDNIYIQRILELLVRETVRSPRRQANAASVDVSVAISN
ncbi:hypothetical protein B9G98_04443 [Wickerhamiella sorbophila]|uniref:Uncharacterized protein n=1 Tax=Wickerhamiella sorbophila TaxID=45607 RepID=A0A2T0FPA3_9ASCO|nr:hypothetical protein B9G98_04443 [Wickerhamiella sorbophila]PRT56823.1 hypothetical protein B9G98_04443 [Wickerhamiella sorbophila]